MNDFKKQIKKGVLEMVILKLLHESDQYGYSIIQQVNSRSNDVLALKDGTLYPILYRLEDNKLIESYWQNTDNSRSRPRKYYRITEKGEETLNVMIEDYIQVYSSINNIVIGG